MDRRSAFRQLAARFLVSFDEMRGQEHISIKELERLEPARLEGLIPLLGRDIAVRTEGKWLVCRDPQTDAVHKVAEVTEESRLLVHLIDGRRNLGEIAALLQESFGWERARAFAHTKKVVFRLLLYQVCSIVNPPVQK